ncbi:TPA: hypothetical protein MYP09_001429 [Citrobacter farmeri]|nr:hypothetical protein [Citrobacter farmeri]
MSLNTYKRKVEKACGVTIAKISYNANTSIDALFWSGWDEEKDEPIEHWVNTGPHGDLIHSIKQKLSTLNK